MSLGNPPQILSTVSTQDGHGPAGVPQQHLDSEQFRSAPRTSRLCLGSLGGAAPATVVGGLTMSERVVDEGQSWASDIIGVLSGVGLYSVLIFLVTFLCLYVPA